MVSNVNLQPPYREVAFVEPPALLVQDAFNRSVARTCAACHRFLPADDAADTTTYNSATVGHRACSRLDPRL